MANFRGGWTPPRHSGTWVGARVASLRCHYPPPRRSQYSRNAKAQPHKSKTSCRGGHRRGTTTSGPGCGPLAGFEVTLYGRFWGDRRGADGYCSERVDSKPPRTNRIFVVGLMVLAVALRLFFWGYTGRTWEDALITVQHSENAARGLGLTHVQEDGRPLHGFTSPLSVLIPLAGDLLSPGFGLTLIRIVSALLGAASVWLGIAIASRLGLAPPLRWMVGAFLAIEHHQILWGMAGMETQVVVTCYLLAFYLHLKGCSFRTGCSLGLCMLARPDAALLVAIVLGFECLRPQVRTRLPRAIAGLLAVYLPWVTFATLYYGSPVPNTIIAKGLGYGSPLAGLSPLAIGKLARLLIWKTTTAFCTLGPVWGGNGTEFDPLYDHYIISRLALLAMAIGFVVALRKRDTSALPLFVFSAAYLAYFIASVRVVFGWYVVPVASISILATAYGLDYCCRAIRNEPIRRRVLVCIAAAYITSLGAILPKTFQAERNIQVYVENGGRKQVGLFLKQVMGPNDTVGTECLGYIGYYAQRRVYDYPGLCSRTVVNYIRAHPDKRDLPGVLEGLRPTYIVVRKFEADRIESWLKRDYHLVRSFQVAPEHVALLLRPDANIDLQFSVFRKN